jgi:hypothetical protein
MVSLIFEKVDTLSQEALDAEYRRTHRTPNCIQCGRLCKILRESKEYDGQGTNLFVTFDCTRCGVYTESMW